VIAEARDLRGNVVRKEYGGGKIENGEPVELEFARGLYAKVCNELAGCVVEPVWEVAT
jgi:hypothetical protein